MIKKVFTPLIFIVLIAIFYVFFTETKTPHILCYQKGEKCFAREAINYISGVYTTSVLSKYCYPTKHLGLEPEYPKNLRRWNILEVNTGKPGLLHFIVKLENKSKTNKKVSSQFSIVIDPVSKKILSGEDFYQAEGKLPSLAIEDPLYLKELIIESNQNLHSLFERQKHLEVCF